MAMSQRNSEYPRLADDDYATPAWVAGTIAPYLHDLGVSNIWEPAAGAGSLSAALGAEGFNVLATSGNFLTESAPPFIDAIVTNPPYGRGDLAGSFIRHALTLDVNAIAMLLRVDFDSAKTRVDLFRDNSHFAGKIALLDRIVWFDRPGAAPSENHAWFVWGRKSSPPWIRYAGKSA